MKKSAVGGCYSRKIVFSQKWSTSTGIVEIGDGDDPEEEARNGGRAALAVEGYLFVHSFFC